MSVGSTGLHFKVRDFIGIVNFEWHNQNKVPNIGIFALWRIFEKNYCGICFTIGTLATCMFVAERLVIDVNAFELLTRCKS